MNEPLDPVAYNGPLGDEELDVGEDMVRAYLEAEELAYRGLCSCGARIPDDEVSCYECRLAYWHDSAEHQQREEPPF